MANQLRARKPNTEMVTKPHVMLFGPPGVGKTWVALDFPKVYYIDTEGGATLPQYQRKLEAADGMYFGKEEGSNHFPTVIAELHTLATTRHDRLTVVVDSFSKLYNVAAAQAEVYVGSDYGKDKKEANKPTRQLMLALERLDMNVVLICHAKDKWVKVGKELANEGHTFDGFEKMEYDLHLLLYVAKGGQAKVHKTRLEGFPRDSAFPWSFAEFERRAGQTLMLRPPRPFVAATPDEVAEVKRLLDAVKIDPEWERKCLAKANVESWEEVDGETIKKCIKYLQDRALGKDEEVETKAKKK